MYVKFKWAIGLVKSWKVWVAAGVCSMLIIVLFYINGAVKYLKEEIMGLHECCADESGPCMQGYYICHHTRLVPRDISQV